jgi:hypothetical protein
MLEEIERSQELGIAERSLGGWRIVAAAWLVAIIFRGAVHGGRRIGFAA